MKNHQPMWQLHRLPATHCNGHAYLHGRGNLARVAPQLLLEHGKGVDVGADEKGNVVSRAL